LEIKNVWQYPIQGRGQSVGVLLFALPKGFVIDEEEETLLMAFFRSASQRLIEVKRIYSLERDSTKKQSDVKSYFNKPSEEEILVLLSKLLISQLQPDICLYINYHEGFKFLYPKYCFRLDERKNLFEKEKPPVLLLKDFLVFESVIHKKKTEIIDLKRSKQDAKVRNLPGFEDLEINNLVIIPLNVSQMVQGFFVIGRESFIEKFSSREIDESEKLISQAALALEEDQILKTAKLTVKQLNRIFDLGSELTLDLSLEKLLEKVSIAIRRTLGWNVVILDLKDQYLESFTNIQILGMNEKDYKKLIDLAGYPPFYSRWKVSFPVGSSYFYDHKQKYAEDEETLIQSFDDQIGSEWNDQDWVYVPIKSRGKLLGVISLNDPVERRRPNEERIRSVEYFANQAAVIIENYELIEGIKSSELKYRMLAETMTMGLVTCDPERNIIYVNQSLAQLLKYESSDQLINKNLGDFVETNSKHKLIKSVHDVLHVEKTQGETNGSAEGLELELLAKDGEEIPFMIYMSPFYQHGKKVGFFGVLADLRNQKKIERLKADFNSMIVHDLRSPLNIIQGYVDIVRTEVVGSITEEQAELLTIAKENVFKVLKLIDNFLIASKLEAGHFQIDPSINSMNGLIDTLWDHYQVLANEKKIKLEKDLDENLPLFSFDKFRMEQVVRNFLSNALKFTPPEGSITLTSRLKKSKSEISAEMQMFAEVSVIDTGVGIPEDELNKVFNKYEQTEAGKDASLKGTGLGLAICREIVDLHNGEVWVKSTLHQGSTFGFSLPIQALKIE
jgi:PAS domain S-box-containing protein